MYSKYIKQKQIKPLTFFHTISVVFYFILFFCLKRSLGTGFAENIKYKFLNKTSTVIEKKYKKKHKI